MSLKRQALLFAVGGVIGLVIDAGIVQALVSFVGWNPYLARVVSFLTAATVTWWWNRSQTFAEHSSGRSLLAEWLHWLALMSAGAVVNYGVYAVLIYLVPSLRPWPAVGAAAGSAAAAVVNFATARILLFRGTKTSV